MSIALCRGLDRDSAEGRETMHLYIMRHGETDDNTRRVLQGQKDNPLNERGRQQALRAKEELSGILFDRVYSSPLIRAVETAVLATGRPREEIILEERLKEISFGVLEGTVLDEMKPPYDNFFKDPLRYATPEGGESLLELSARTWSFLSEIRGTLPGKKVLLVSHGAAIHSMIYQIRKEKIDCFWNMNLGNCGILEISDETGDYKIEKECNRKDSHYIKF